MAGNPSENDENKFEAMHAEEFAEKVSDFLARGCIKIKRQMNQINEAVHKSQFDYTNAVAAAHTNCHRDVNIYTYDHNRVILQADGKGSDYINASFVQGLAGDKEYIASQAPIDTTVYDHWQMIWEHDIKSVIMLANFTEDGVNKCCHYWSNELSKSVGFGKVRVTLVKQFEYETYVLRKFVLNDNKTRHSSRDPRSLHHFQFTHWPSRAQPIPETFHPFFLAARNELKEQAYNQPALVHCSDGIGRTGVFIALDLLVRSLPNIDIYNTVLKLRNCRINMVQSWQQLKFIYEYLHYYIAKETDYARDLLAEKNWEIDGKAFEEEEDDDDDEFDSINTKYSRLSSAEITFDQEDKKYMSELSTHDFIQYAQKMLANQQKRVEEEFQDLAKKNGELYAKCSTSVAELNADKNRFNNIHPFDSNRVTLQLPDGRFGYINASFIRGNSSDKEYIASQGPMRHTANDMWLMIWQYDVQVVIMLAKCTDHSAESSFQYWSDVTGFCKTFGSVAVVLKDCEPHNSHTERVFEISAASKGRAGNEVKTVHHLQFTEWPDHGVPNIERFLQFFTAAHNLLKKIGYKQPVLVHCSAGVGRTGTFIALDLLVRTSPNIDVRSVILKLRQCRMYMVQTTTQLAFIYKFMACYIRNMMHRRRQYIDPSQYQTQ